MLREWKISEYSFLFPRVPPVSVPEMFLLFFESTEFKTCCTGNLIELTFEKSILGSFFFCSTIFLNLIFFWGSGWKSLIISGDITLFGFWNFISLNFFGTTTRFFPCRPSGGFTSAGLLGSGWCEYRLLKVWYWSRSYVLKRSIFGLSSLSSYFLSYASLFFLSKSCFFWILSFR